jgi:hypothetical protein
MTQELTNMDSHLRASGPERVRPRASNYFWRPWYARLWWAAAFVCWFVIAIDAFVGRFLPRLTAPFHISC